MTSLRKLPRWVWVFLLGTVLLMPMLGQYGLWDPAELRHADVAREVAKKGSFGDITLNKRYRPRPPLYVWLVAIGFKLFGVNELAGRLPLALCGLIALLLAYRFTRRLIDERAGLLAAFVLATTPAFLFQSRQLASDVVFYACLTASVGGLLAFIWPADGKRIRADLAIAAVGLALGALSRGAILGTALPLASVTIAAALSWSLKNRSSEIWVAESGDDLAEDQTLGESLLPEFRSIGIALAGVAAVIGLAALLTKNGHYILFGGELRKLARPPTFESPMKLVGWGMFPWFALVPMALTTFLWAQRDSEDGRKRDAFPKMALVLVCVIGYVAASFWPAYLGKVRYPALPLLALAVGVTVYEAWVGNMRHGLWGLAAAGLILALQQDFVMAPRSLAFSHLLEHAKYPVDLKIKTAVRLVGLGMALTLLMALRGGVERFVRRRLDFAKTKKQLGLEGKLPFLRAAYWAANGVLGIFSRIGDGLRFLGGPRDRHFWLAAGAIALGFGGWCSLWLTPHLSLHMSNKALFETYHRCKSSGERLSQYMVSGRGAAYYNNGQVDQIRSRSALFKLLKGQKRAFVLVPSSHLGSLDQAARRAKIPYHVLDDRNSHYLIISNKVAGACAQDKNPLRELVVRTRPNPKHKLFVNFESKVQLLGYDLPDKVTRGGKFTIKLYFKVLSRLPAGYKIFIHFDQPAHRFHGDHKPLGGKYPTQYWLPGDYIIDPHTVELPLLTTPSGRYTMWMGFWRGSRRLKVIKGRHDGRNRVRLGVLRVR